MPATPYREAFQARTARCEPDPKKGAPPAAAGQRDTSHSECGRPAILQQAKGVAVSLYDLIVVGAGSGGTGAAITAAREGMRVLWLEKEALLGGTGTNAYVNVWQPAYTAGDLAREIAQRLLDKGAAQYIAPDRSTPSGRPLCRRATGVSWQQTLRRWVDLKTRTTAPPFVYTPKGMDATLREMAAETGRIDLWDNCVFLDVHTAQGREGLRSITAIEVQTLRERERIEARFFIDATADIHLARKAGCAWTMGREASETYGEPSAPKQPEFRMNGWSLCFLTREGPNRIVHEPGEGPDSSWAHIGEMPDGGFYVNMCFQIPGEVAWAMGQEQAREYLIGNIYKRWPGVQQAYGLENQGIVSIAPRAGVREGPRLVGRYVLNEVDFRRGRLGRHHQDCVAFCDHAMDSHLPGEGCTEAPNGPFGVPFRSLQPREIDNLLVASRGASFSSLAASACRLQRTMMDLGEAAGYCWATGRIIQPELPAYEGWQTSS